VTDAIDDLPRVLEDALTVYFGRSCAITALRRRPYVYSASFALEDLEVELADGTSLRLIVKDLGTSGLLQDARAYKPAFLYEPRREIETYQQLLKPARLGTAACYGAVADADSARYWLFLEKVQALELYQVGDVDVWVEVATWLAGMHSCSSLEVESVQQRNPHLISYDAAYYRKWLDRATSYIGDGGSHDERRALEAVAEALEVALERLAEVPRTLVHGEFYASNVLIGEGTAGRRICPVDWEMAGIGPGLLDLGALSSGWEDENRRAIARAYHTAWAKEAWATEDRSFMNLLRCCELCLAVQWLGWAPQWQPPPEHARDWLSEASKLAGQLNQ
jgi:hypothetical protein